MVAYHPEFLQVARRLERFHDVFLALWDLGEPTFTERIDTAAVVFNRRGAPMRLLFNRTFWDSLSDYELDFILCHEMLHVVLNHGFRSKGMDDCFLANVAADLAVNHLLTDAFGFIRSLIRNWENFCWVDTVFAANAPLFPATNLTMEQYYRLLCSAGFVPNKALVDVHFFESNLDGSLLSRSAARAIGSYLSDLPGHVLAEFKRKIGCEAAAAYGEEAGVAGMGVEIHVEPIPRRVRWESILRMRMKIRPSSTVRSSWIQPNRRLGHLDDMMMPSESETTTFAPHRDQQQCVFFVDSSGSTAHEQARFLGFAQSLPTPPFHVTLCSFDTEVYQLDSKKPVLRGGGGTSFAIMERWIQREYCRQNCRYPDVVIVLTDGHGDFVRPAHPERWHWLLTSQNDRCVPAQSATIRI